MIRKKSKVEKVIWGIYQDLYKNSTPKANFKKLVRDAKVGEDGKKEIPFDDYEIDADLYNLIVETHLVKANLSPYEEKAVRLEAYLGCGPRSTKKELPLQERIHKLVYEDTPTEHEMGFNPEELKNIIEGVKAMSPTFNQEKWEEAMMCNTCVRNNRGETVTYHCDVYKALICAVEDRSLRVGEWD